MNGKAVASRSRHNAGVARKALSLVAACVSLSVTGTAAAAPPPPSLYDSATGSGSAGVFSAFDFNVTSDPSGGSPSGVTTTDAFGIHFVGASITCLVVTGNTATFAGTLEANAFGLTNFKVTVVDNGPAGSSLDTYAAAATTTPQDCLTATTASQAAVTSGDVVVTHSPSPTSISQCTNGGYAQFGFLNQGLCTAFVLPVAAPAARDSAIGSGSTLFYSFGFNVSSNPSGGRPGGSATADGFGGHFASASISCLSVRGNTATFAGALQPGSGFTATNFKITVADNGPPESGLDTYAAEGSTVPLHCSTDTTASQATLTSGDIAVIDSP